MRHLPHNSHAGGIVVPVLATLVLLAPFSAFAYEIQQGAFDDQPYPDQPTPEPPPADSGNSGGIHSSGSSGGGMTIVPLSGGIQSGNTGNNTQAAALGGTSLPGLKILSTGATGTSSQQSNTNFNGTTSSQHPPAGSITSNWRKDIAIGWPLLLLLLLLLVLYLRRRKKKTSKQDRYR